MLKTGLTRLMVLPAFDCGVELEPDGEPAPELLRPLQLLSAKPVLYVANPDGLDRGGRAGSPFFIFQYTLAGYGVFGLHAYTDLQSVVWPG